VISRPERQQSLARGEHVVGHAFRLDGVAFGRDDPFVGALRRGHDQGARAVGVAEVCDAHADARDLVLVGGADALARCADRAGAARAFVDAVELLVIRQQHVRAAADADLRLGVDAARAQLVDLFEELLEVHHHAVAEQAARGGVQNARRDLVENDLITFDVHGVPGVRAALVARDDADLGGQHIDNLPLPLVAPLCADDDDAAEIVHDGPAPGQARATRSALAGTGAGRRFRFSVEEYPRARGGATLCA
jgi:hypothetical protein